MTNIYSRKHAFLEDLDSLLKVVELVVHLLGQGPTHLLPEQVGSSFERKKFKSGNKIILQ